MGDVRKPWRITRREALAAGAAAGTSLIARPRPALARSARRLDFARMPDGVGWGSGWNTIDVANLRTVGGLGLLEAGSDVFPNDPRPLAFAVDCRLRDAEVRAEIVRPGSAPGVVLRRVAPDTFYAAVYDSQAGALVLMRKVRGDITELARAGVPAALAPVTLSLRAEGSGPTALLARLTDATGRVHEVGAPDYTLALEQPGDPGVLATAVTFLTEAEEGFAPFGNARLGLFGTQEGGSFQGTPAGRAYLDLVRERSTAAFRSVAIESRERPRRTPASVVAASSGVSVVGGARLGVATDLPASVAVEVSLNPRFRRRWVLRHRPTSDFEGMSLHVRGLPAGRQVYWRARVRRAGITRTGPVRSFRALPRAGQRSPVRLAIGSCATRFGPSFDLLAQRRPDVFVWQGDLNYPDTHGPLAQTMPGYAGIWRAFLRNPRLAPILERSLFAPQRDDHDYGVQDARAGQLPGFGVRPWERLVEDRLHYRFTAGLVEVWVLEQRRHKSDPTLLDTPAKTLLGAEQRAWLLRTLASSKAPFKVICSPCTLHYGGNARDGNWDAGFRAERELLLSHVRERVSGRTIFVTGDAHDTMVYDKDGLFEARAAPLDIPDPRDHPGVQAGMVGGEGVAYADTASHFAVIDVGGGARTAVMQLTLVREDGAEPYTRRFEAPIPRAPRRRRRRRRRRRGRRR